MIKSIVTNINLLRKPCLIVEPNDNIVDIIKDLKDTLIANKRGWALSANQIGYDKKVAYIRMPKAYNSKEKKVTEYFELVIINPVILEKDRKIMVKNEECLSLPGLSVDTDRYVFITLEYENEKREKNTVALQDLEALCVQHEIAHLQGKTILDYKHKAR